MIFMNSVSTITINRRQLIESHEQFRHEIFAFFTKMIL